jgi:lambda repressor-like predicted transcriptional regulator
MTPADIKYELEKAGYSQVDVARLCRVHRQTVNAVIRGSGRSKRVEEAIGGLLQKPLATVWPHWYGDSIQANRRRRMTPSEMFARLQQLEAAVAAAKSKAA